MKNIKNKVIIISGDSSGIGLELVNILKKDNIVYGLSRRNISSNDYTHFAIDILDSDKLNDTIDNIYKKEGRIDLVISCSGTGISGAIETTPNEDIKYQLDVNFLGTVNLDKAVLPYLRKDRNGRIVHISSVAAIAPIPFQSFYSASKAAINNYSLALANEVRPFNIKVITVMPGDVKTNFTSNRKKIEDTNNLYEDRVNRSVSKMEKDEQNGQSPIYIAKKIINIINKKNPKNLYTLSFSYKFLAFLIKILPTNLVNKILYRMYAK